MRPTPRLSGAGSPIDSRITSVSWKWPSVIKLRQRIPTLKLRGTGPPTNSRMASVSWKRQSLMRLRQKRPTPKLRGGVLTVGQSRCLEQDWTDYQNREKWNKIILMSMYIEANEQWYYSHTIMNTTLLIMIHHNLSLRWPYTHRQSYIHN